MMNNSQEELQHVLDLLQIELEEDKKQYQEKMKYMSLAQKREEGFAWYPIVFKDTYYGMGERLIVEIERPSGKEIPHQFQSGKMVKLFSNSEKKDERGELGGVVSAVRENFLKIVFFADELPDWADRGKVGVELMFDESSYREMEAAIKQVMKAKNNRVADLREILLGYDKASFNTKMDEVIVKSLNNAQNRAMNNIIRANDLAIVHGPPGTGKTTTLIEAIVQVLEEEDQVLVCAPSNTAVDLLTEKLASRNIQVARIGNPARVNEDQLKHTIDLQVTNHRDFKRIKELRKSANDLRNIAVRYKRNFGREEREQRKTVLNEARKMAEEAGAIENYIIKDILNKARVITCTLVGSSNQAIRDKQYSTIFIDEAAQALEPACWIPILRAERVVLAGDHFQLPPTVKSYEAGKGGLTTTLFEKAIQRQEADVMLEVQYRMNEKIMQFSNSQFYKGKLSADSSVKNHTLNLKNQEEAFPVEFIDTAGAGYNEQTDPKTLSTFNQEEANLLLNHLKILCSNLKGEEEGPKHTCGIITPYKAQKELLISLVEKDEVLAGAPLKISVNTVDGFQGQERDIIYISLVRSNDEGEIGFLSDVRRMNVALTRAKKKLIVIGDSATLGENAFYKNFLTYIESINAYKSAWEYINL